MLAFVFRLSPTLSTALCYINASMTRNLDRFFNREGHFYCPPFLDEADEKTMVVVVKSVGNVPRADRLVIKRVVKTGLDSGVKVPACHLSSGDPGIMGIQITQMLLRTVTYRTKKSDLQDYVYQVNISVNLLKSDWGVQVLAELAEPASMEDMEPEELSFAGTRDYRATRKCLHFNSTVGCEVAKVGGFCGSPLAPLVHVCDCPMPDGFHCARPHSHVEHDYMMAKERYYRIEQGLDLDRPWDPLFDLHTGAMETGIFDPARLPGIAQGEARQLMDLQVARNLESWFVARYDCQAIVTFRTERGLRYERYMKQLEEGNAWSDPFITVLSDREDHNLSKELSFRLQQEGERVFPGEEYVPAGSLVSYGLISGFVSNLIMQARLHPERGTKPGGFNPLHKGELAAAMRDQLEERQDYEAHMESQEYRDGIKDMVDMVEATPLVYAQFARTSLDGDSGEPETLEADGARHGLDVNRAKVSTMMADQGYTKVEARTGVFVYVPPDVPEAARWDWANKISAHTYKIALDRAGPAFVPKHVRLPASKYGKVCVSYRVLYSGLQFSFLDFWRC